LVETNPKIGRVYSKRKMSEESLLHDHSKGKGKEKNSSRLLIALNIKRRHI